MPCLYALVVLLVCIHIFVTQKGVEVPQSPHKKNNLFLYFYVSSKEFTYFFIYIKKIVFNIIISLGLLVL